ncbi:MAG: DUF4956 domain-containing protein [Marinilabiliaceae bacterium]
MDDFSDFVDASQSGVALGAADMVVRFLFNLVVVFGLARCLYYPRGRRRDYLFVFIIISISIFLMVNLLGALKIKVGFALGLFAIFGIVRYRTEQMPVREMSYLFVIISLSVINGLSQNLTLAQTIVANLLLVAAIWVTELEVGLKSVSSKLIAYDDVSKIKPGQRDDLIADLRERTGLHIIQVEVGHIDFLRDMAMLRVFYEAGKDAPADDSIGSITKLPKEF